MSNEKETREKFKLEIEPEEFKPIGEFKLTTSSDLGKLAYAVFSQVFADFEGVIFEPGNGGEPTYSLIFNHGKYEDDEMVGVKSAVSAKSDSSSVVDRIRTLDNLYKNGAKYLATEDLMDVVEKLLIPQYYNGGKPKWGQIVVDFSERSYSIYNSNVVQYTKINGISAKRLAALIYGYKTDEDSYDYEVRVVGPAVANPMGGKPNNWILQISRASYSEVNALYKAYGYTTSPSNIIKG